MFGFLDSLCGCFSPDLKRNIIEYLNSAKLNRQLIEQEKTNEQSQQPEESIYSQVKTKSYYFMKLQQEDSEQPQSPEDELVQNQLQPNYYPQDASTSIDDIYHVKFAVLQKLLTAQLGVQYSKVYDSQDETALKIFCKGEIYQNKRFNSYRFSFKIPHKQHPLTPKDYLELKPEQYQLHEPLIAAKLKLSTTDKGVEVYHRKYKKILVVNQHDFYTAEHAQTVTENNAEVAYNTLFSVKGEWEKLSDFSRGWINLAGLRVAQVKPQEGDSNSLHEEDSYLQFEGYINVELQISVNSNMLKQPIAKEIRVYVQKLICSLTKSDAI